MDDDDSHICLRCRTTIVGLDNYVQHRQSGCGATHTKLHTPERDLKHGDEEKEEEEEEEEGETEKQGEHEKDLEGTRNTCHHLGANEIASTIYDQTKEGSDSQGQENIGHNVGSELSTTLYDSRSKEYDSRSKVDALYDSQSKVYDSQSKADTLYDSQNKAHSRETQENISHLGTNDGKYVNSGISTIYDTQTKDPPTTQSPMHVSYSMDYQISQGQTPERQPKPQDLTISKDTQRQAPFTGYTDPLLPHSQDPANIFRQFDTFGKITEGESHTDSMGLFKVSSLSYDLETKNFETRYSDFYSLQHSSQEPLLTTVPTLQQSKAKQGLKEVKKDVRRDEVTEMRDEAEMSKEYRGNQDGDESKDFPKQDLRQDDFLSSLELSSVKAGTKRRLEDDDEDDDDDDMRPPRHHTGGKWRPGSRPPPSSGGKWRPGTPKDELEVEEEMAEEYIEEELPPPPTYTKGKWLPGKKMTNIIKVGSSVEYHCQACSRTLKGKEAYERHLNSELHFVNENKASGKRRAKKSKVVPSEIVTSRPQRSKKLAAKSFLKTTIAGLKSRKITSTETKSKKVEATENKGVVASLSDCKNMYVKPDELTEDEDEIEASKTIQVSTKLLCPICKLSFGEAYAAMHFASLAHIHNELEYRENRNEEIDSDFNKLLLQNFNAIVKTSPFICDPCKFYCNLHEDFLTHMKSHEDDPKDTEVKTLFSCSACSDEEEMRLASVLQHLQTPHHFYNAKDCVMQTQQVIIISRTAVVCPVCDGVFRYMREYRNHRRVAHQEPGFQFSDQRFLKCPQCDFKALREWQIRDHIRKSHDDNIKGGNYNCFVCGLAFASHVQAVAHRRSAEHRTTLWRQKGISVSRICRICYKELEDLASLRRHMTQEHLKDCTPCHFCGVVFPLRCDLAKHQKMCRKVPGDMSGKHKCDLCTFKNDLHAHVLMHKTLVHGQKGANNRHSCHICKTDLLFSSVKGHMLAHTNEWPHACHLCSRKFPEQEWRDNHLLSAHTREHATVVAEGPALCDICGKTLSNRWHLYRHKQEAHARPSTLTTKPRSPRASKLTKKASPSKTKPLCDVCGVQCDSVNHLKLHRKGHKMREGDKYECPHCSYKTERHPHLRRHLRLHTGSTPFSCHYCSYVCNNQENLRKHMLKTMKHPGRFMYECRLCFTPGDTLEDHPGASEPMDTETQKGAESRGRRTRDAALSKALEAVSNPVEAVSNPPGSSSYGSDVPQSSKTKDYQSKSKTNPQHDAAVSSRTRRASNPPQKASDRTQRVSDSNQTVFNPIPKEKADIRVDKGTKLAPVCEVFKSNYAKEFQAHLLENHKEAFLTKDEMKIHIRSYYQPEEDATFTNAPIPFTPKKRIGRHSESQDSDDEIDEPGSEDDDKEDVLSQLRRTLNIDDYVEGRTTAGDDEETMVKDDGVPEEVDEGDREMRFEASTSLLHPGRQGSQEGVVKIQGGSSCSYQRPPTATSSGTLQPPPSQPQPQPQGTQTLKVMVQQVGEDDGSRHVVIVLQDHLLNPSEVEALLPCLGLTANPNDCVAISPLQTTHHQIPVESQEQNLEHCQAQIIEETSDHGEVIHTDQVISMEEDEEMIHQSEDTGHGGHGGQVILYPQDQEMQDERSQGHSGEPGQVLIYQGHEVPQEKGQIIHERPRGHEGQVILYPQDQEMQDERSQGQSGEPGQVLIYQGHEVPQEKGQIIHERPRGHEGQVILYPQDQEMQDERSQGQSGEPGQVLIYQGHEVPQEKGQIIHERPRGHEGQVILYPQDQEMQDERSQGQSGEPGQVLIYQGHEVPQEKGQIIHERPRGHEGQVILYPQDQEMQDERSQGQSGEPGQVLIYQGHEVPQEKGQIIHERPRGHEGQVILHPQDQEMQDERSQGQSGEPGQVILYQGQELQPEKGQIIHEGPRGQEGQVILYPQGQEKGQLIQETRIIQGQSGELGQQEGQVILYPQEQMRSGQGQIIEDSGQQQGQQVIVYPQEQEIGSGNGHVVEETAMLEAEEPGQHQGPHEGQHEIEDPMTEEQGHPQVILYPEGQDIPEKPLVFQIPPPLQKRKGLRDAHLSPLQVVAKAAEVLTQNESPGSHFSPPVLHEVLSHGDIGSEVVLTHTVESGMLTERQTVPSSVAPSLIGSSEAQGRPRGILQSPQEHIPPSASTSILQSTQEPIPPQILRRSSQELIPPQILRRSSASTNILQSSQELIPPQILRPRSARVSTPNVITEHITEASHPAQPQRPLQPSSVHSQSILTQSPITTLPLNVITEPLHIAKPPILTQPVSSSQIILTQPSSGTVTTPSLILTQPPTLPSSHQILTQPLTTVPSSQIILTQPSTVPTQSQIFLTQPSSVPSSSQLILTQSSVPTSSQIILTQPPANTITQKVITEPILIPHQPQIILTQPPNTAQSHRILTQPQSVQSQPQKVITEPIPIPHQPQIILTQPPNTAQPQSVQSQPQKVITEQIPIPHQPQIILTQPPNTAQPHRIIAQPQKVITEPIPSQPNRIITQPQSILPQPQRIQLHSAFPQPQRFQRQPHNISTSQPHSVTPQPHRIISPHNIVPPQSRILTQVAQPHRITQPHIITGHSTVLPQPQMENEDGEVRVGGEGRGGDEVGQDAEVGEGRE